MRCGRRASYHRPHIRPESHGKCAQIFRQLRHGKSFAWRDLPAWWPGGSSGAETIFEPLRLPDWTLTLMVVLGHLGFRSQWRSRGRSEIPDRVQKRSPDPIGSECTGRRQPQTPATLPPSVVRVPPQASVAVLFRDMSEAQDQGILRCVAEEISTA